MDTDVLKLQQALERYRAKYKAQKEAKHQLQETCRHLEIILAQRNREYQELRGTLDMENASTEQATVTEKKVTNYLLALAPDKFARIQEVFKFMEAFTKIKRPLTSNLRPVFLDFEDLSRRISSDAKLNRLGRDSPYCFPERVAWCPAHDNHGLSFGRMRIFSDNQWEENVSAIYGQTFRLLFEAEGSIYYAGEYECVNLKNEFPQGISVARSDPTAWKALSMVTPSDKKSKKNDVLSKLQSGDSGLVEPLGLRCIGFNIQQHHVQFAQEPISALGTKQ